MRVNSATSAFRRLPGCVASTCRATAAAAAHQAPSNRPWPQRCRTHYHRNLLTRVPKTAQPWVSTLVRTIFEQPNPVSVRAQHAQVVAALEAKLPAAAAHLDDAREDILAFTAFPARSGGRSGATTRIKERLNKEVRRRTMWSASSPAATPSSAWSARCWPSRTMNGPSPAAIWAWKYSPPAGRRPSLIWERIALVRLD